MCPILDGYVVMTVF